jgi:type I restriction enzyme M protein
MVAEYKELKESIVAELIELGEKEGLLKISGKKIEYLAVKKSYNITDPEEQVRVSFYYELTKKYQYPKERIDLEVLVPRREPTDKADIVVYEDDEKKKPYIVVECKKDGISQAEIKQAIEQAFGNANSLRSKYTILVAGNVKIAFDITNFSPKEREKNIIADIPVRYGKVIKFKYRKGDSQWDLRDVTRDELLAKFQQCHDTLWEGGKRNPAEAFDEMSKLMYCKIQDERFLTKKGEYYRFQVGTYETMNEVAERIRKIYKDAQDIDPEVFIESIKADNPIIYTVAEILQGISLARTDLDVKGEGYEHFLGGVFRGAMGQYFTPRPIVRFMIDFLEPGIDDFLIDPACGSGGFLIYTLERMRKELFAKLDEKDAAYRWQDFALKQVYGIEINSQLARVSMMNMIIHEDGHTNIENADALDNPNNWKRQKIREYFSKKFTLLLTNPPFGASVKEREKPYLANYELGAKVKKRNRQNTEILFIERCLDLLKPGGRMGTVLPDGILTNSSLQYVRDFINERAQILGVVSLPQAAFKRPASKGSGDSGSGVKASLLFLRKKKDDENLPKDYPIFMAIAEHIGYDATGRPDKDEFPDILNAWQEFRKKSRINFFVKAPLCFAVGWGEMEGRWEPSFYKLEFRQQIDAFELTKFPFINLGKVIESIRYGTSSPPKYVDAGIPFIRATNIKDGHIIQEDMKFMTPEESKNFEKCRLKEDDIIIVRSGVNTGDCARITKEFNNAYAAYDLILDLKSSVNSEYINVLLNLDFGKLQIQRVKARSAQPHLNANEVKSLRFPFPPLEIQDKIASMMSGAYKAKKEKEAEANELLNSIEPYLSEQLGISQEKFQTETPQIFSVSSDIVKGKHLSPFYYLFEVRKGSVLKNVDYPLLKLEELATINPKRKIKISLDAFVPYIGLPETDEFSGEVKNIINRPYRDVKGRGVIKKGDILFARIEPSIYNKKYIYVTDLKDNEFTLTSTEFYVVEPKGDITGNYLFYMLRSNFVYNQILGKITGTTGRRRLDIFAFRNILIPVPPLPNQERIAYEVQNRREKAKKLKREARELLEKAKREVEEFIKKK